MFVAALVTYLVGFGVAVKCPTNDPLDINELSEPHVTMKYENDVLYASVEVVYDDSLAVHIGFRPSKVGADNLCEIHGSPINVTGWDAVDLCYNNVSSYPIYGTSIWARQINSCDKVIYSFSLPLSDFLSSCASSGITVVTLSSNTVAIKGMLFVTLNRGDFEAVSFSYPFSFVNSIAVTTENMPVPADVILTNNEIRVSVPETAGNVSYCGLSLSDESGNLLVTSLTQCICFVECAIERDVVYRMDITASNFFNLQRSILFAAIPKNCLDNCQVGDNVQGKIVTQQTISFEFSPSEPDLLLLVMQTDDRYVLRLDSNHDSTGPLTHVRVHSSDTLDEVIVNNGQSTDSGLQPQMVSPYEVSFLKPDHVHETLTITVTNSAGYTKAYSYLQNSTTIAPYITQAEEDSRETTTCGMELLPSPGDDETLPDDGDELPDEDGGFTLTKSPSLLLAGTIAAICIGVLVM